VDQAEGKTALERTDRATSSTGEAVVVVRDKTFLLRDGVWVDTAYDAERMTPLKVGFMSDDYFALVAARPEWGPYLAVSERVLVVLDDGGTSQAYLVVAEGEGERIQIPPAQTPEQGSAGQTPVPQRTPLPEPTRTARSTPTAGDAPKDPVTNLPVPRRPALCSGGIAAVLLALLAALAALSFTRAR
jgi:hypothetical protein